jgi:hypothetical protein
MVLGTLVLGIAIAMVRCIWAVRYRVEYVQLWPFISYNWL